MTTVELLPVQEFDHVEFVGRNPLNGQWLTNYWGYSPIDFMAPNVGYAAGGADEGRTSANSKRWY